MVTLSPFSSARKITSSPGAFSERRIGIRLMGSLRSRMTLFILLGVVPIVLGALQLQAFHAGRIINEETEQTLDLEAQRLADRVTQWDRMNSLLVQNLSRQPGVSPLTPQQLRPLLVSTHRTYQDQVWSIGAVNPEGGFMALSEKETIEPLNFSDRRWFQEAIKGQPITRETIITRRTGEPAVIFSAPIYAEGGDRLIPQGVIRVGMVLTEISKVIDMTQIGETGFAFLVDEQGQLLAHPNHRLLEGSLKDFSDYPPVQRLLKGEEGPLNFTDRDRIRWLSTSVKLANGWGIVLMQQKSEVLAPQQSYHRSAILLSLLTLIVVGSITWHFSRWVTQPLTNLTEAVWNLSKGQWTQRVYLSQEDELGTLAKAFNRMAAQLQLTFKALQAAKDDLELKVAERTQQLNTTLEELQQTQAQMIQSEKMSSLGQMVAGVAHEINNPVGFIHGNLAHAQTYAEDLLSLVQLYRESYPQPPEAIQEEIEAIELDFLLEDFPKTLQSMQVGTVRIREIVKSLRNFSRLDEAEVKQVNVHEGIDSTLMILQNRLKCGDTYAAIEVTKHYQELPAITCYPGQLNQVFMNLLSNAIDALEERNHQLDQQSLKENPSQITITTEPLRNDWISIRIRDNGSGIPESAQPRLFDPFFTTKPIGKGTGLGLSISYQIITQRHGGRLWFESSPEKGTEFVVEIPVMNSAVD
ncbi:sensor histidine kinase [Roseofilum capinflatum]|uniref:histidine kinase n=1 Tax=Roseofilum capinflatum BLCC-M114 TaxID=3022440 RepID=A0ABT7B6X3_9CYAN|nr:ATP-binding protein [Roseofilum capinflatum]MDJ1174860.1 ATP-binding protein [Roseofilum capinflatum BLCC-M114]